MMANESRSTVRENGRIKDEKPPGAARKIEFDSFATIRLPSGLSSLLV
jgi:hypothetical protein